MTETTRQKEFNRISDIIRNPNNKFYHIETIEKIIENYGRKYGYELSLYSLLKEKLNQYKLNK